MNDETINEVINALEQTRVILTEVKDILAWLLKNHHEGSGEFENRIIKAIELIGSPE